MAPTAHNAAHSNPEPQGEAAPEVGGLRAYQQARAGGPLVLFHSADLDGSVETMKNASGHVVGPASSVLSHPM